MDDDFRPRIHPSLEIPDYWTPEMACEFADFLSGIIQASWTIHGTAMARYFEHPHPREAPPASLDDELPF